MVGQRSLSSSSSESGVNQFTKFLIISCFLVSVAYHSFAGNQYRKNLSNVRDATLRGRHVAMNEVPLESSSTSYTSNQSIFHKSYNSLYKTDNTRMLSESEKEEEELQEELSIEVSFENTYKTIVFLGVVFTLGEIANWLGIPSLVGHMIAGFLLGPPLLEYVPYPESFVLLGDLGLILLLIEAGIELDVGLVKEAGVRPILIAFGGSMVSLGVGIGIAFWHGESFKNAITAGAVFSPTSLAVAANALSTGKALNTPVGQLIVASCVIDDIIALVILSMLEVLVKESPAVYEYFIPLISAVGYLVVLGISAITWIPWVIENKIFPLFKRPEHRQYVALALLYLLVLGYLPMMYYSRASYLTGAFLAGLSFSQIEGVHHTWMAEAGSLMEWLLRIFFSAAIGFQVPIQQFGDSSVIAWGFAFYIAVLSKLPVGLFAPKYNESLPAEYPFNPYTRDVMITSVAMSCRGEFSFIIAAFGIGEDLLDTKLYSAIVFAVLLSAITSPIALTLVLKHYNNLSAKYLEQEQMEKSIKEGKAPLHLNIQIRSKIAPGIQISIKNVCNSMGLFIIDQRSWQPRGLDVILATELYAIDGKTFVNVGQSLVAIGKEEEHAHGDTDVSNNGERHVRFDETESSTPVNDTISERCCAIQQALLAHSDLRDANIRVLQWVPMADNKHSDSALIGEITTALNKKETIDTLVDDKPTQRTQRTKMLSDPVSFHDAEKTQRQEADIEAEAQDVEPILQRPIDEAQPSAQRDKRGLIRRRRNKTVSSPIVGGGSTLWEDDSQIQDAVERGATSPVTYDLQVGRRRQRMPSDLQAIAEATPLIEERLEGLVRTTLDEPDSSPFSGSLTSSMTKLYRKSSS